MTRLLIAALLAALISATIVACQEPVRQTDVPADNRPSGGKVSTPR